MTWHWFTSTRSLNPLRWSYLALMLWWSVAAPLSLLWTVPPIPVQAQTTTGVTTTNARVCRSVVVQPGEDFPATAYSTQVACNVLQQGCEVVGSSICVRADRDIHTQPTLHYCPYPVSPWMDTGEACELPDGVGIQTEQELILTESGNSIIYDYNNQPITCDPSRVYSACVRGQICIRDSNSNYIWVAASPTDPDGGTCYNNRDYVHQTGQEIDQNQRKCPMNARYCICTDRIVQVGYEDQTRQTIGPNQVCSDNAGVITEIALDNFQGTVLTRDIEQGFTTEQQLYDMTGEFVDSATQTADDVINAVAYPIIYPIVAVPANVAAFFVGDEAVVNWMDDIYDPNLSWWDPRRAIGGCARRGVLKNIVTNTVEFGGDCLAPAAVTGFEAGAIAVGGTYLFQTASTLGTAGTINMLFQSANTASFSMATGMTAGEVLLLQSTVAASSQVLSTYAAGAVAVGVTAAGINYVDDLAANPVAQQTVSFIVTHPLEITLAVSNTCNLVASNFNFGTENGPVEFTPNASSILQAYSYTSGGYFNSAVSDESFNVVSNSISNGISIPCTNFND